MGLVPFNKCFNPSIPQGVIGLTVEGLMDIFNGTIIFSTKDFRLFIFSSSFFSHNLWQCWDPSNERHLFAGRASREINWLTHPLPPNFLLELKMATWTIMVTTNSIVSAIANTQIAIAFFSHLCKVSCKYGKHVTSLSHVTFRDISESISTFKNMSQTLKKKLSFYLGCLTEPHIARHIGVASGWNKADISNIRWKMHPEGLDNGRTPTPSEVFFIRSNCNRAIVRDFLEAMAVSPEDIDFNPEFEALRQHNKLLLQVYPNFRHLFKEYTATQLKLNAALKQFKSKKITLGERNVIQTRLSKDFFNSTFQNPNNPLTRGEMSRILRRVRAAALSLITMYAGMRQSELKSIQQTVGAVGNLRCLRCECGMWYLYASVIKGKSESTPLNIDRWVAPDVIRDSIKALEFRQLITNSKYLLTSFGSGNVKTDIPVMHPNVFLRKHLESQLKSKNIQYDPNNWDIHTDRHTLVKELYQADVHLVYITRQLNHTHKMLSDAKISESSLDYGRIGSRFYTNPGLSTDLEEYKLEAKRLRYHAVLGENAKIAGVGAPAFQSHVDQKFKALGLFGQERSYYIDMLATSGLPLRMSGFGICGDLMFPQEKELPCTGDYECDPTCKNCVVIPEKKHIAIIEFQHAILEQLKPSQSHNINHWKHRENLFHNILVDLNEDPSAIKLSLLNLVR